MQQVACGSRARSRLQACEAARPPDAALPPRAPRRDTFRHYVAQDAHYLHFFARAYACALDKCSGLFPEARVVLQQLLMGGACVPIKEG